MLVTPRSTRPHEWIKNSGPFPGVPAGTFHPPSKKAKVLSKKKGKSTGPNLTGATTNFASDADRDSVLIESGMEAQEGTSAGTFDACISEHRGTHFFLHLTSGYFEMHFACQFRFTDSTLLD